MTRVFCSLCILHCSFLLVCASTGGAPHVVFILADDLGYGDVQCYNPASKIETPNIDQLAAGGVRFTDAHSGGAICVPSRYALLTGRFAVRANMSVRDGPVIKPGRSTVASLLHDHGYTTHMVGKWHLGFVTRPRPAREQFDYTEPFTGGPIDRGFDSFFGMHASLDIPPYFFLRDRNPVTLPTQHIAASSSSGSRDGWNDIQGAFWREGKIASDFEHAQVTPRFADEAVKVIESYNASRSEEPLFLYLALPSPHTPWLPSDEFVGTSSAGAYGDFVAQVDSVVGRVMAALDEAGMSEDTLLAFSSDNGPVWYEKDVEKFAHSATAGLRGMKFSSWEGGHRVPFLVRWPARAPANALAEQTIVFSDVYATFAELVGMPQVPAGAAEDSVSFLPSVLHPTRPQEPRPPIVHDRRTIRDGDWKLILPAKDDGSLGELYNLKTDLYETDNLIGQYPKVANRMKANLLAIRDQ